MSNEKSRLLAGPSAPPTQHIDHELHKETPIPWGVTITCSFLQFVEVFNLFGIFAYNVYLVSWFGISHQQQGVYVGLLGSAWPVGQTISSYFWGILSDKYGRKVSLQLGAAATGTLSFVFGLSTNIWSALLFRLLGGVCNGNTGILKALLADNSDKTNQSRVFSLYGLAYGFGIILAPSLSGYLAQNSYLMATFPFVAQHPFAPPCMIQSLLSWLGFLIVCLCVQGGSKQESKPTIEHVKAEGAVSLNTDKNESAAGLRAKAASLPNDHTLNDNHNHHHHRQFMLDQVYEENDSGQFQRTWSQRPGADPQDKTDALALGLDLEDIDSEGEDCWSNRLSAMVNTTPTVELDFRTWNSNTEDGYDADRSASMNAPGSQASQAQGKYQSMPLLNRISERSQEAAAPVRIKSFIPIFERQTVRMSIFAYATTGFIQVLVDEVFPIFAASPLQYGGLGFNTMELSLAFLISGMTMFVWQLGFYPSTVKKLGAVGSFRFGLGSSIVSSMFFAVTLIVRNMYKESKLFWVFLALAMVTKVVGQTTAFISVNLCVSNSAERSNRGAIQGMAQAATSLARAIGPFTGGTFWSFLMLLAFVPYHQALFYVVNMCLAYALLRWSRGMPSSLNSPADS